MISVIGLGYIGLPTALLFAKNGIKVLGTDKNVALVESLKEGSFTTEEKGLEALYKDAIKASLEFTCEYRKTDVYIIAVPTPFNKNSKRLDTLPLIEAINSVLDVCGKGAILIIESTISPGTVDRYIRPEINRRKLNIGRDIFLVHAPERILPGNMVYELINNARTIGVDEKEVGQQVKELYSSFCKADIVLTDIRTAEMSKVIENTYRDINIAFANELAKICRADKMNVYEVIDIANRHPRVNILQPGPGVGGHCISVDPWFLVGDYPDLTNMILTARKTNDSMPTHVMSRIRDIMRENNINDLSKVGLYGLTYKEDVDDIRESPTLQLLEKLDESLAFGVRVYDPLVNIAIVDNQYLDFDLFLQEVEIFVIMVGHRHIKEHMELIKEKLILDTRNVCSYDMAYKL